MGKSLFSAPWHHVALQFHRLPLSFKARRSSREMYALHTHTHSPSPLSFSFANHIIILYHCTACWSVMHASRHRNVIVIISLYSSMNDSRLNLNWLTRSDLPSSRASTKQKLLWLLRSVYSYYLYSISSALFYFKLFFLLVFLISHRLLPLSLPLHE